MPPVELATEPPFGNLARQMNKLMDQLRYRLESKAFENSKLYYHMDDYKASVTSFKNLLRDYPASKYREEVMYLVFESEYLLAENSIDSKKNERYNLALVSYGEFTTAFPQSRFRKDADDYAKDCRKRLEKYSALK